MKKSFVTSFTRRQGVRPKQIHEYITVTGSLLLYFVGSDPETSEAVQTVPPAGQKSSGITRSVNQIQQDEWL